RQVNVFQRSVEPDLLGWSAISPRHRTGTAEWMLESCGENLVRCHFQKLADTQRREVRHGAADVNVPKAINRDLVKHELAGFSRIFGGWLTSSRLRFENIMSVILFAHPLRRWIADAVERIVTEPHRFRIVAKLRLLVHVIVEFQKPQIDLQV